MNLRTPHGRRLWLFLVAALTLFLTARVIDIQRQSQATNFIQLTQRAQKRVQKTTEQMDATVSRIIPYITPLKLDIASLSKAIVKENKVRNFYLFVFENKHLVCWSDNRVIPDSTALGAWKDQEVVNYKNGWYYVLKRKTADRTLIGLWLIKNQYTYQNKYIINRFNTVLSLPQHTSLSIMQEQGDHPVFRKDGKYLFSLGFDNEVAKRSYGASAGCYWFALAFAF